MCGICGVLDFGAEALDPETLERMNETLRHRGPDDAGLYAEGPVMLGHRRLSIIDLSPTGHQPMQSPDGSVALVYNGETYNFPELRQELASRGHVFRGSSDTEVVLAAYLEWGEACFAKLNGMFALALWDARKRRLLLARDRFGIKPLHYRWQDGRLVFGSEIKAILEHGDPRRLDWGFLHEYLWYGTSLLDQSAFQGIRKLLPGHFLRVDAQGASEHAYWRFEDLVERRESEPELRDRIRELLERAVARHLIADVPVAVFLSGGIDSSAVTVLAAKHYAGKLKTFSVGFDFSPDHDERPVARRLAEEVGTEHHELFVTTDDLEPVIEGLVGSHDEPFGDAANIPLVLLCRQLRGHGVKVALQGDGGDEIFAGYRRYNVLSWERLWRRLAKPGLPALRWLPDAPLNQRLQRFLGAVSEPDPGVQLALLMTQEDRGSQPERILAPEARRAIEGSDPLRAWRQVAGALGHLDAVQRSLWADCRLLLPDQFLPKVDRSTMSQSIETRVPFLDTELTDFVMPIPSRHKVKRLQKKHLLRSALRGIVPDYVLDAPKRGFGVPYARWLRDRLRPYMESVLLDAGTRRSGLFDAPALERCIAEHVAGTRDHGFLLWKALNLALWQDRYRVGASLPAVREPLFVVGMGRSGTTLLYETLATHRDLGWFNHHFERAPRWPAAAALARLCDWSPAFRKSVTPSGEARGWLERFRDGPAEAYSVWEVHCGEKFRFEYLLGQRATPEERDAMNRVVARVLHHQSKPRFVTKLTGPARLGYVTSLFPDANFVHVIRDGRAVVASLLRADFWRKSFRMTEPAWRGGLPETYLRTWQDRGRSPAVLAGLQWRNVVERAREERAALHPDVYLEVRYEDFRNDPEAVLAQIGEATGLAPCARMNAWAAQRLRHGPATERFREVFEPRELALLNELLGDLLEELGYRL